MLKLDNYDVSILAVLQREGRITKQRLSEQVNLSQSPCHERVKRLEKNGLIKEYNAQVDLAKFAIHSTFFVTIVLERHQKSDFQIFENRIAQYEQVIECHALGGGLDYILKIIEKDISTYQLLMESILEARLGIAQYYTYIVTKSVFGPRGAPLAYLFDSSEKK